MHRKEPFDSFDFDNKTVVNNKIQSVAAVQADIPVNNRKRNLPGMNDALLQELEAQTFFVRGFKQSGPEMSMNIDCQSDHTLAQRAAVREAHL